MAKKKVKVKAKREPAMEAIDMVEADMNELNDRIDSGEEEIIEDSETYAPYATEPFPEQTKYAPKEEQMASQKYTPTAVRVENARKQANMVQPDVNLDADRFITPKEGTRPRKLVVRIPKKPFSKASAEAAKKKVKVSPKQKRK